MKTKVVRGGDISRGDCGAPSTENSAPERGKKALRYLRIWGRYRLRVLFVGTRESHVFDRIREENVLLRLRVTFTHALTRERFTFHGNGQKTSQKCVNGVSKKHRNGKGGETARGTPVKRPNAYKETLPLLAGWWDGMGWAVGGLGGLGGLGWVGWAGLGWLAGWLGGQIDWFRLRQYYSITRAVLRPYYGSTGPVLRQY